MESKIFSFQQFQKRKKKWKLNQQIGNNDIWFDFSHKSKKKKQTQNKERREKKRGTHKNRKRR